MSFERTNKWLTVFLLTIACFMFMNAIYLIWIYRLARDVKQMLLIMIQNAILVVPQT